MSIFAGIAKEAIVGAVGSILKPITDTVQAYFNKQISEEEMNARVTEALVGTFGPLLEAQSKVIMAETQSEDWLTRNWRPIVALTAFFSYWYVIVVVPHLALWGWFGTGPSGAPLAPRFGELGLQNLFWLTSIAVGGYVGGRTIEKTAKTIMNKWSR